MEVICSLRRFKKTFFVYFEFFTEWKKSLNLMFTHVHRLLLSESLSVHLPSRSRAGLSKGSRNTRTLNRVWPTRECFKQSHLFFKEMENFSSEVLTLWGIRYTPRMHRNLGITNLQQSFAASYIRSVHVFSYTAKIFSKWLCNFNLIHKPLKWIEKNNTNLNNSWPTRTYKKPYLPCIPSASAALPGSSTACYAPSSGFRTITADCRR